MASSLSEWLARSVHLLQHRSGNCRQGLTSEMERRNIVNPKQQYRKSNTVARSSGYRGDDATAFFLYEDLAPFRRPTLRPTPAESARTDKNGQRPPQLQTYTNLPVISACFQGGRPPDAFIAIPSARQPQFFSNPDVHQAGRRKSAKQSQAARADTGRVSELRARRAGSLEHDVGHDAWIIGSGHHLGERLAQGSANLAILIELGVGLQEV